MENNDIKMVSLGLTIVLNILQKDFIPQARLNVLVKEVVADHRAKQINGAYSNLSEEFYNALTTGPDKFINMVHDEISKMHSVETFAIMRNVCPLMAYTLVTDIKAIAKYGACQSISNRVYNAYVSAIQSLDGLI